MNITYLTPEKVTISTSDMQCCEQLLLWSIRTWVMGAIRKVDSKHKLQHAYESYKIPEASTALDHFMYCLSFGAKRAIDIRCPLSGSISPDELTLMNFMAHCQQHNEILARCMLRDLCIDKYLIQTKYHAMIFTDLILNKANMTLTCLKLTRPSPNPLQDDTKPVFPPSLTYKQ